MNISDIEIYGGAARENKRICVYSLRRWSWTESNLSQICCSNFLFFFKSDFSFGGEKGTDFPSICCCCCFSGFALHNSVFHQLLFQWSKAEASAVASSLWAAAASFVLPREETVGNFELGGWKFGTDVATREKEKRRRRRAKSGFSSSSSFALLFAEAQSCQMASKSPGNCELCAHFNDHNPAEALQRRQFKCCKKGGKSSIQTRWETAVRKKQKSWKRAAISHCHRKRQQQTSSLDFELEISLMLPKQKKWCLSTRISFPWKDRGIFSGPLSTRQLSESSLF